LSDELDMIFLNLADVLLSSLNEYWTLKFFKCSIVHIKILLLINALKQQAALTILGELVSLARSIYADIEIFIFQLLPIILDINQFIAPST
jgi:hypothetical protein